MMLLTSAEEIKDQIQNTDVSKMGEYLDKALDWLVAKGVVLLLTCLFLFIGSKLIKWLLKIIKKSFERSKVSESVTGFLLSLIKIVLYCLLFISAVSLLGFQVTSFVTILGTAGVAVGLALQGSLSNLAGGVLILILKPFEVGDYILENGTGCEGTVRSIDIFYTRLVTPDNKLVVIPNGNLSSTSVVNLTDEATRRVELSINISYDSDMKAAKEALTKAAKDCGHLVEEKPIQVFVSDFSDRSIKMGLMFFAPTAHFWDAKWAAAENMKKYLDEAGVQIPHLKVDLVSGNGDAAR